VSDARVSDLLAEVGVPCACGDRTTIEGEDPVLPVTFPIGERAAVALAACASVASLLWAERTGRSQDVGVAVPQAAASLISFTFLRVDGRPLPGNDSVARSALVALHQCRDGRWIHLHGATPKLQAGTLKVLGCEAEPAEVAAAVGRWDSSELEDALAAEGTCGAIVRTASEWATHPQGQAVGALARVEVTKVAEGEPGPVGDGLRPLGGVRVLDLTRVLAGPTHGRVLAEHGADVLLVNSPTLPNVPGFVIDTSHGKLSTFLDLDEPADTTRLLELLGTADVFAQGYRSGALERRGLGVEDVVEVAAKAGRGIVYVTINCYGDTGPWRTRPGWEQLAQSVTGLAAAHGTPEQPVLMPAAACDYTTGYLAALGTMAALWRRATEGGSYHVRASLCQTGMWLERGGPLYDRSGATGLGGLGGWMTESDTPWGRLSHLAPVARMSDTPPQWERPSSPLGSDPPRWP